MAAPIASSRRACSGRGTAPGGKWARRSAVMSAPLGYSVPPSVGRAAPGSLPSHFVSHALRSARILGWSLGYVTTPRCLAGTGGRRMVTPVRRALIAVAFALSLGLCGVWPARAQVIPTAADCAALMSASLSFKDKGSLDYRYAGRMAANARSVEPVLTKAVMVAPTATVPEYCRVEGGIPTGNAAEGTNTVRFGVNLPTSW